MILEVAILNVRDGMEKQFEEGFATAGKLISSIKGYVQHSLRKCLEVTLVDKIMAPSYFLYSDTTEQSQIESAMKSYKVKPID